MIINYNGQDWTLNQLEWRVLTHMSKSSDKWFFFRELDAELNFHSANVPSILAGMRLLRWRHAKPEGKKHWVLNYQISELGKGLVENGKIIEYPAKVRKFGILPSLDLGL